MCIIFSHEAFPVRLQLDLLNDKHSPTSKTRTYLQNGGIATREVTNSHHIQAASEWRGD